jgi:hypothetical protein
LLFEAKLPADPLIECLLNQLTFWLIVAISPLVTLTTGCGRNSENRVVIDPNAGTSAQQKALDDYDKQQRAADASYR